jgi:aspartate/methionine/tyrosine aminotransferase
VTRSRAPYMEWAKSRPVPRWDLAGSNLAGCTLEDLPGSKSAVDIAGESPDGFRPLVEAIARHHGVPPERIATASGCSGANFLAMAAILETGDEVLVESPGYDPLPAAARMLGAAVRTFPRLFEEGWALDPDRIERAIGPRTRLIAITNPHNPSGALATGGQMRSLAALADRTGVRILVDEVYRDTIFGARPAPAAALSPRIASTASLTKAYGLASLRCGWALAAPDWTAAIRRARDVVDVWAPIPADRLSVVAFEHLERLSERARAIVEGNLAIFRRFLADQPRLECAPFATTLAFPRLAGRQDSAGFVQSLLTGYGVAVAPGHFFDAPAHFRVALGGRTEALEAGLAALAQALAQEP